LFVRQCGVDAEQPVRMRQRLGYGTRPLCGGRIHYPSYVVVVTLCLVGKSVNGTRDRRADGKTIVASAHQISLRNAHVCISEDAADAHVSMRWP